VAPAALLGVLRRFRVKTQGVTGSVPLTLSSINRSIVPSFEPS